MVCHLGGAARYIFRKSLLLVTTVHWLSLNTHIVKSVRKDHSSWQEKVVCLDRWFFWSGSCTDDISEKTHCAWITLVRGNIQGWQMLFPDSMQVRWVESSINTENCNTYVIGFNTDVLFLCSSIKPHAITEIHKHLTLLNRPNAIEFSFLQKFHLCNSGLTE